MKILIPVKRVIDPFAKVRPMADGSGIDSTGVKFEINPFDEIALEEAVRIKEKNPTTEVIAVSIGKLECEDQLRKALAIGADSAILVESIGELDSNAIAGELEALVADMKPDFILMGKQGSDDDNGQVGGMLAAKLDWPQASFASKVVIDGRKVIVTRETDTGEETLELPFPCVITTDLRLNEPRYVALPGIIKARSKPLERRSMTNKPQIKTKPTKFEAPPPRAAGRKVANVSELLDALREKGVLA